MICAAESSMWGGLGLGKSETYPERAGAPDCAYYMRTGVCGYASRCRFNHPPDRATVILFFLSSSVSFLSIYYMYKKMTLFKKKKISVMWGCVFQSGGFFFVLCFKSSLLLCLSYTIKCRLKQLLEPQDSIPNALVLSLVK